MREELLYAINKQRELNQKLDFWNKQQKNVDGFPPQDHPISQEKWSNYLRMEENRCRFQDCLVKSSLISQAWIDGSTMVFAKWDNSEAQVVIEFSFYGPIVFLSFYGTLDEEINKAIDHCLSKNHLIKLNEEEIKELIDQGLFNSFF